MTYQEFLSQKTRQAGDAGFKPIFLPDSLFDFQRMIDEWAIRKGRAAIFADCGFGKTAMQLTWAENVVRKTGGRALIFAPLAVAPQTVAEGVKFGITARHAREGLEKHDRIVVTNYERMHYFSPHDFTGVVLDESSILKSFTGKFKNKLVNDWGQCAYKLCCTATPAPNDYMELGNHSEFLGVLRGCEMISAYFINDPSQVGHYRVKGHAESAFWKWVSSWACLLRMPSDIGCEDGDFVLPNLNIHEVHTNAGTAPDGMLFPIMAHTMSERRLARKASIDARVEAVANIANATTDSFLAWCDLNEESAKLTKLIHGAVEVKGSDSEDHKERAMRDFQLGNIRCLVSKPSIAGWGMNFQHCHRMAFTGLSDSFEQYYQAVRRCWRFGQRHDVECHVVTDVTEGAVVENIRRKQRDAERMAEQMRKHMAEFQDFSGYQNFTKSYHATSSLTIPSWLGGVSSHEQLYRPGQW